MNMLNENDPRITAYALGELDPAEHPEVEAMIRSDGQLRIAVEETRRTATMISAGLAAEPATGLTALQRQRIQQQPKPTPGKPGNPLIFRSRSLWAGVSLAAAACLVVAVCLPQMGKARERSRFAGQLPQEAAPPESRMQDLAKQAAAEHGAVMRQDAPATPTGSAAPMGGLRGGGASDGTTLGSEPLNYDFASVQAVPGPAPGATAAPPRPAAADGMTSGSAGAEGAAKARGGLDTPQLMPSTERSSNTGQQGRAKSSDQSGKKEAHPADRGEESASRKPGAAAASAPSPAIAAGDAQSPIAPAAPVAPGKVVADEESKRLKDKAAENDLGAEDFRHLADNPFLKAIEHPNPTFSIDVDTASYSNIRRFLSDGRLPPPDAVRIEEMINYFHYAYEPPSGDAPFSANVEISTAPWNPAHRLVRIGLKGREIKLDMRPATSLVFLLDVSGSMNQPDKLPLVKESMKLLVNKLNGDDRLAIVTYAGETRILLESTYCSDQKKPEILAAIDGLHSGGATAGASGIQLAYDTAVAGFIKGGVNRVILCTDGDFNVGASGGALTRMIEEKRQTGVFLSVLGFGKGNLKEAQMEELANHGNGNFAYIDRIEEGKKVLVDQMGGTLVTIAKDVKVLFDFNPAKVGAYRLIGYEDRLLASEDFANDKKDAGEIGAGHTVTALFEIIPPGEPAALPETPQSDFIEKGKLVESDLFGKLKVRYKQPDGEVSKELVFPVKDEGKPIDAASADFRFAAAVAQFGMILRQTPAELRGDATLAGVLSLAAGSPEADDDAEGYRAEFIKLVRQARQLAGEPIAPPGPSPSLNGTNGNH